LSLQTEIEANRKRINTDAYPMSVGELVNMYRDGELIIDPEYQRLFRWSDEQKASLIDSLLLGIPLPSIFVSQRDDGKWELIDGLQRVSTILELVGILKNPDGSIRPRLILHATKLLPSLKGKYWVDDDPHQDQDALPSTERLLIKRSRIQVQIVKKESDASSKFELFQRLNSLGAPLQPMEIRNSLLSMIDSRFAVWIKELAEDPNFRTCIDLSDNQLDQLYDRELVCRFIAFRQVAVDQLRDVDEIADFVDDRVVSLISDQSFDQAFEGRVFSATFQLFESALRDDSFRRFDSVAGKFKGGFLVSAFEVLALGLGHRNPIAKPVQASDLARIARELWTNPTFTKNSGAGVRASTRIKQTIPLGRALLPA
jgi:hypothetical protein